MPKTISAFTKFTQCTEFTDSIENQIYFIRALSDIQDLIIIGVGIDVQQKKIDAVIEHIRKKMPDSITFFVHNFSQDMELGQCRKEDNKIISNIIRHKIPTVKDYKDQIPKIFSDYSKKLKRIPAVVAYTNTGDLGGNKQKTNGYACLIA